MKKFITILIMFILYSCATPVKVVKIENQKTDAFSRESLFRYSDMRLEKLAQNPKYRELANCYRGNIDDSIEVYKSVYLKNKNNTEYWLHIGNCYYLKHAYSKARFFYNFSIGLAKGNNRLLSATYNNLALIELKKRRYNSALGLFKKSIIANQSLITPKFNISQLYLKFNLASKAVFYLNSILRKAKGNEEIISSLATAHLMDNNPKKAITFFKKIDNQSITREDIAINYALALYLRKNYTKALEIISNSNSMGLSNLAQTKDLLKDKIKDTISKLEDERERKAQAKAKKVKKKKG